MDIIKFFKDLRRNLFLNSQYCTYYNTGKNTVLAGIMRDKGYRYSVVLPDEKLKAVNDVYRKFTTIMNSVMAFELVLYVYLVIFPYFLQIIKLPLFIAVLLMALVPLVALYVTYMVVNLFYEDYLNRYVGTFTKVKFQPTINNVNEKAYNEYKYTSRKSVYVLALITLLFVSYIMAPFAIEGFINSKKYKAALNLSNLYIKLVPINAEVYAQRAFAEFKLQKYQQSVNDFENANKYSLSNNFDYDILGVKTYYLDKESVLKEFDRLIQAEEDQGYKYYLMSQKATYLVKVKDYNEAIKLYNPLIKFYEKDLEAPFDADAAYYRRAAARAAIGDVEGAKRDFAVVKEVCPDCEFDNETSLVREF